MATIHTRIEPKRGCGYSKPGGIYLIGGAGPAALCCKLPYPLTVCPYCGEGIKQIRSFRWITSDLFSDFCPFGPGACVLAKRSERMGLLWVGKQFYKSVEEHNREEDILGISRHIPTIPYDLEPGKTWIALAHPRALNSYDESTGQIEFFPGVFRVFLLSAIEYVVKGDETEEELKRMQNRGTDLINVIPEGQQTTLGI